MLEAAGWHGHPSAAGGRSTMLSLWYPTASADPPTSSHHTHGLLSNQIGEGRKRRLPLTEQPPFPLCHTLHFSIARSFGFINQGISGSSTRDTLNSCAVAPSGSSFAMTTSRWLPVLALSYFRQQVESVRMVSPSEKVTPSKSSQFFRATVSKKLVRSSPVGTGAI